MPSPETKTCQNCQSPFEIDASDFDFYEKMRVPPPTFCPECRFQRRYMFRNERTLYKNKCGICNKSIIAIFPEDKPQTVYCGDCWRSDKWDALDYGMDYDSKIGFFNQLKELMKKVPWMNLIVDPDLLNSEYVNHAGNLKNCYLIFNADGCENVHYSAVLINVRETMDVDMVSDSELCFESVNLGKCNRVLFSEDCTSSSELYFCKDMVNCTDCFGCAGLRGKSNYIFNQPYSKEEYEKKIKEFDFGSYEEMLKIREKAREFWLTIPRKYIHGLYNKDVSGDYVYESKNSKDCYQCRYLEDSKFCQFITMKPAKDVYDYSEWGDGAQRIYECVTVGQGADFVKFCFSCWMQGTSNMEYSVLCNGASESFGCMGIKKKKYCILNKQYTKEEYEKLREQIVRDMNDKPYADSMSRVWKYGEFFPYDISPFAYNESASAQYFPLSREEIESRGWEWREPTKPAYDVTLQGDKIPDHIKDIEDSILKEVLECKNCERVFRLTPAEFALLRRFGAPVPRKCPDCRHMDRLARMNLSKLWEGRCQCAGKTSNPSTRAKLGAGQDIEHRTTNNFYTNTVEHFHGDEHCPNEFQTAYDPEGRDIVYCEDCYKAEIV